MKWIKIEDEQPIIGRNVIAVGTWMGQNHGVGEDEYMGLGVWKGDFVAIESDSTNVGIVGVTHWMYIPAHPEA